MTEEIKEQEKKNSLKTKEDKQKYLLELDSAIKNLISQLGYVNGQRELVLQLLEEE